MSNPYRDMCAELIGELHEYKVAHPNHGTDIIDRARDLPDQPEPEGPTTAELMNLSAACNSPSVFARAVLARWGRPTPQPVAVSESPWERTGWCDEQGQCWLGDPGGGGADPSWQLTDPRDVGPYHTHSLPASALPTPETTNG